MGKIEIICTCCNNKVLRWPYETKVPRKGGYVCKSCHIKNGTKVTKTCVVCSKDFTVTTKVAKKQVTCSYACSNKYFRTGENNGNWKEKAYRSTCFKHHDKCCVVCEERNIVEVHHLDENKKNNKPTNLIPLCPTHHQYWHSKFKYLVLDKIITYVNNFKINNPDIA